MGPADEVFLDLYQFLAIPPNHGLKRNATGGGGHKGPGLDFRRFPEINFLDVAEIYRQHSAYRMDSVKKLIIDKLYRYLHSLICFEVNIGHIVFSE